MTLPQRTLDDTNQTHLDDHNDSLTQLFNDLPVDTTTAAPQNGDSLVFDGTKWVPATVSVDVAAYYTLSTDAAAVAGRTIYIQSGTPTMSDGDIWFKIP